ncbi:VOC family protein [Inquilinus sp. CAU 1745]|uniref:VOC family protein n=1 Tax=Inquilinus sp. CAU 1745 TaxID=3140369 RepID=UPI00325C1DA9
MTAPPAFDGVDHLLVGVADLERARSAWERLGFTVTPRGRHVGWGTANYCVMFGIDYIELLGIVDPAQHVQGLDRFLEREGEGTLGLAFGTDDADRTFRAFDRAGIAGDLPKRLGRMLELPEGDVRPEFDLIHPREAGALGVNGFVCRHRTPELIRRAEWLDHPNGAEGIASLTLAVTDPATVAGRYLALLGEGAVGEDGEGWTIAAGPHRILLRFGAAPAGEIIETRITCRDLDRAAALLAEAEISHERAGQLIAVDPAAATGVRLFLTEGG